MGSPTERREPKARATTVEKRVGQWSVVVTKVTTSNDASQPAVDDVTGKLEKLGVQFVSDEKEVAVAKLTPLEKTMATLKGKINETKQPTNGPQEKTSDPSDDSATAKTQGSLQLKKLKRVPTPPDASSQWVTSPTNETNPRTSKHKEIPPLLPPQAFSYDFEAPFHRSRVEAWYNFLYTRSSGSKFLVSPESKHLLALVAHLLRLRGRQYVLRLKTMIGYTGNWKTFWDLLADTKQLFKIKSNVPGAKDKPSCESEAASFRIGLSVKDPPGADYESGIPRPVNLSGPLDSLVYFFYRVLWEAGGCQNAVRLDEELFVGFASMSAEWRTLLKEQDMTLTTFHLCKLRPDLFRLDEAMRKDAQPRTQRPKFAVLVAPNDATLSAEQEAREAVALKARIEEAFAKDSRLVLRLEELAAMTMPAIRFETGKIPFPQQGLLNFLLSERDSYLVCDSNSGVDLPLYSVARLASFIEPGKPPSTTTTTTTTTPLLPQHPLSKIRAFNDLLTFLLARIGEIPSGFPVSYMSSAITVPGSGLNTPYVSALLTLVGGFEQLCRILDETGVLQLTYVMGADGKVVPVVTLPTVESHGQVSVASNVFAPVSVPPQQTVSLPPAYLEAFERELLDEVRRNLPTQADISLRQFILERIQRSITKAWGPGIVVYAFGSTSNGLGTKTDDLDICIVTERHGVQASGPWLNMYALAQICRNCGFSEVVAISHARVPIVKIKFFAYGGAEIAADINVNNNVALWNTRLLRTYLLLDPRVRPFLMAVKAWSKRRQVNNPSAGWLSSYSFVLMGLTFLVMRGVVPCLQRVEADRPKQLCQTVVPGSTKVPRNVRKGQRAEVKIQPEAQAVDVTFRDFTEFCGVVKGVGLPSSGGVVLIPPGMTAELRPIEMDLASVKVQHRSTNSEPLAALLHGFFDTYSKFNRRNSAVSLRDGKFIPRSRERFRNDPLVTEDPFIEHNTTRNVSEVACGTLVSEFRRAAEMMAAHMPYWMVCAPWEDGSTNGSGRL